MTLACPKCQTSCFCRICLWLHSCKAGILLARSMWFLSEVLGLTRQILMANHHFPEFNDKLLGNLWQTEVDILKDKGSPFLCEFTVEYISSSPKRQCKLYTFGHAQHRDHPLSGPLEVGSSVPSSKRSDRGMPPIALP